MQQAPPLLGPLQLRRITVLDRAAPPQQPAQTLRPSRLSRRRRPLRTRRTLALGGWALRAARGRRIRKGMPILRSSLWRSSRRASQTRWPRARSSRPLPPLLHSPPPLGGGGALPLALPWAPPRALGRGHLRAATLSRRFFPARLLVVSLAYLTPSVAPLLRFRHLDTALQTKPLIPHH